ncbi:trypsin-like serine peptidase [Staphylococcus ratti]|uniref:Serine protease n=1 Tax=Staphylococcus ratti TaxID=2892440 RepID=A0ABY3PEU7_9STAP|nr:trypsin-like peptidase domain-containing protein [Staphylococcus ratti]UEX90847.1 trypsin-like peptidase domain-containing protein [Staphylococcus ratti]
MKQKIFYIMSIILFTYAFIMPNANATEDNRKLVTDVFNEKGSLATAKYESGKGHHCTAVMLTPTVGLTAAHCNDRQFEEGNIGTLYPGESGLATEAGHITVSTFNPYSTQDIALIKGTNPTTAYAHYMQNVNTKVGTVNDSLNGKEVYSIGYPYEKSGYKQYKTEGTITNVAGNVIHSTLQSSPGQSGSGVFLKETDELVGIIVQGNLDGSIIVGITPEIRDWINTKMTS